jgi:hypothetical protein
MIAVEPRQQEDPGEVRVPSKFKGTKRKQLIQERKYQLTNWSHPYQELFDK